MSQQSKLFAITVIAAAAACLVGAMLLTNGLEHWAMFGHCLALALVSSTFKIRLPGMRSTIAGSFVLFLVAIASLNFAETLILTVPCTVLQCLWRTRSRPAAIAVVFSVASTVVSTSAAALLFYSVDRAGTLVPALIVAATVYFFVNSWLIAAIVGLTRSESISRLWRDIHRWALPYYLGGAIIASVVVAYSRLTGFHQALAMTPLLYAVYVCYESYVSSESKRLETGTVTH